MELKLKKKLTMKIYNLSGWLGGWVVDKTKLMLKSTQVEDVVELGVELGNKIMMEIVATNVVAVICLTAHRLQHCCLCQ